MSKNPVYWSLLTPIEVQTGACLIKAETKEGQETTSTTVVTQDGMIGE